MTVDLEPAPPRPEPKRNGLDRAVRWYFDLQPVLIPVYAILLAFAVGSIVILLVGANPLEAYWSLIQGTWAPDRLAA